MPENKVRHPSEKTLAAFLQETIENPQHLEVVSRHIDACGRCQKVLERLNTDSMDDHYQEHAESIDDNTPTSETAETELPFEIPSILRSHPSYIVQSVIGEGGMGTIFKVLQTRINREEAVKVIKEEALRHSTARQRFQREIEAVGKLSHPNVVILYNAESKGQAMMLSMELVDGMSLHECLKRRKKPLPINVGCWYVWQVCQGLQHAHEQGLVHRDIKPHNLMVTRDGKTIKILDFGLATLSSSELDAQEHDLTKDGAMMGTPDYIAPEQATDSRKADIRSDIYSLGCTLFYLLTGRPPFKGETPMEVIRKHWNDAPPVLHQHREDAPEALSALLLRAMDKNSNRRFKDPATFAKALEPFWRKPDSKRKPAPRRRWSWRMALLLGTIVLVPLLLLWGPGIIRFMTNKGQIVIETEGKDVEVTVKKGGKEILVVDTKEKRSFNIEAGEVELVIREVPDGIRVVSKKFAISRGGREIVNVRLELDQWKAKPTSPPKLETILTMGSTGNDRAVNAAVNSKGEVVVLAWTDKPIDLNPQGEKSIVQAKDVTRIVARYSAEQKLQWSGTITGKGSFQVDGVATSDSGLSWFAGFFDKEVTITFQKETKKLTGTGETDLFIGQVDAKGNLKWLHQIGGPRRQSAKELTIGKNDVVNVLGFFQGKTDFDPDPKRTVELDHPWSHKQIQSGTAFLMQLDAYGNFRHVGAIGVCGATHTLDRQGNILVTGSFWNLGAAAARVGNRVHPLMPGGQALLNRGTRDGFLLKMTPRGKVLWTLTFGGVGSEGGERLLTDEKGNIYLTGQFHRSAIFDSRSSKVTLNAQGSGPNTFLAKWNSEGTIQWARSLGARSRGEMIAHLGLDQNGNLHVGGDFKGSMMETRSRGGYDLSWLSFDSDGRLLSSATLGGMGDEISVRLMNDNAGRLYWLGQYQNNARLDFDTKAKRQTSRGESDLFLMRLKP